MSSECLEVWKRKGLEAEEILEEGSKADGRNDQDARTLPLTPLSYADSLQ